MQSLIAPGTLNKRPLTILHEVSGALRPGRMTLLLGPPDAGKSTLLKLLASRLHESKQLRIDGSVRYNGSAPFDFVVARTVGYVDENDEHIQAMTVADTLNFAWACQNGDSREAHEFDPRGAMEDHHEKQVRALHTRDLTVRAQ